MTAFHLQGPVPIDSPYHVSRGFEQRLLSEALAHRWALLLGPRQHGKTTGLIQVREKLLGLGLACALLDLGAAPACSSYQELLRWISHDIARGLDQSFGSEPGPDEDGELYPWLCSAAGSTRGPIVLMIDEASAIRVPYWCETFYGQVRSLTSRRAQATLDELVSRLVFVFSGMFRPETLVTDRNSPFNVCVRIETEDLTLSDALELWQRANSDADESVVHDAFRAVGGQPYLLQVLFSNLVVVDGPHRKSALEHAIEGFRTGTDDHFQRLFEHVLSDDNLVAIASDMAKSESDGVPHRPLDPNLSYLEVLGLGRRDGSRFVFRNPLYAEMSKSHQEFRKIGFRTSQPGP